MQVGSFEQMQKEFQNGTYNLTQNGKCTGCGNCCSNLLPMTDEEIEVIRKYIKRFHIKEQKINLPLAEPMLDLMCPFLDNSKKCEKCTIYEVRPHICRQFSCDPKQRPQLDLSYGLKALVRDVRNTFFGSEV